MYHRGLSLERPPSARSTGSSSTKYSARSVSLAGPTPTPSSGGNHKAPQDKDPEFMLECKAAYLTVLKSTKDNITTDHELLQMLYAGGRNPTNKSIQRYWNTQTGYVTFDQFCRIMQREKPTGHSELMNAFKTIDRNNDKFITHDELYKVLSQRGEQMTRAEIQKIFDQADVNRDGKLDYKEFCDMMMATTDKFKKAAKEKAEKGKKPGKKGTVSSQTQGSIDGSQSLKSPLTKRQSSLKKDAKNAANWKKVTRKGCFHIEDNGKITSHQYVLDLPTSSNVLITIQALKVKRQPDYLQKVDTMMFILREGQSELKQLSGFTDCKDGLKHQVRCDLMAGKYLLLPFTTGCRLKPRKYHPDKPATLVLQSNDTATLTPLCRKILGDLFDMLDLDGNGTLNREEFSLFQKKASNEDLDNDSWEVIEKNFDMKNDEVTRKGFMDLHAREALEEPDDLWVTLSSMGYGKQLDLDEALPFSVEVCAEACQPTVKVCNVQPGGRTMENAMIEHVKTFGNSSNIKSMNDLLMYNYTAESHATLVIENSSRRNINIRLDCSKSKNVECNGESLEKTVNVGARTAIIAMHLMPKDDMQEWNVKCTESIV